MRSRQAWALAVVGLLPVVVGCVGGPVRRPIDTAAPTPSGPAMSATSTGDPVWEAAVDGAQRTLSVFETRLRSEDDATVVYGLRVVVDGRLLWLDAVMRRPPGFAGIVDTDSDGPARGAVIVVGREAVVDWIIADAVGIHGGYTLRVERDRLPEAEQRTFDAELGAPLLPLP